MANWKITAFYRDSVSNFGWSLTNIVSAANQAAASALFSAFQTAYAAAQGVQVYLDAVQFLDMSGGQAATIVDGSNYPGINQGQIAQATQPTADGLLFQGYGGPVRKGRSEWLMHGIARTLAVNSNVWDLTAGALTALKTAADNYFRQYRPVASPHFGFPPVNPPQAFNSSQLNQYIRLRRTGRTFLRGGQGLRNR